MDNILKRFTSFDKLIATSLIKLLYWIGIALILIGVLVAMFGGFSQGFGAGVAGLIVAPIGGVLAIVFWRFLCEVYIVIFGMYDRLGEILKTLQRSA